MNEDSNVEDLQAPEDALPPPTAPEGFPLSLNGGFDSKEQATEFANMVVGAIRVLSSFIDVERLDGVTIADDYDLALRNLDRGFEPGEPLARSNDERIVGVGMAPAVLRNGIVKGHLVFFTPAL